MWSLNKQRLRKSSLSMSLAMTVCAVASHATPAAASTKPSAASAAKPSAATTFQALETRLSKASEGGDFVPPEAARVERAEALFLRLAKGAAPADVAAEAQSLSLEIESVGTLLIIREADHAREGRGFFVLSRDARPDILLVPHAFKDEMTREIGLHLFSEGRFSAAAWNTVPRHYNRQGQRVDADMAHLDVTWFNAFTRAMARAWPSGQTLQIHGFAQDKRKNAAGANADLILSNGTRTPGPLFLQRQQCLAAKLGRTVQLYSNTFRELGGTSNAQLAILTRLNYRGFIHMEMSRPLREALRKAPADRAAVLDCLLP